MTFKIRIGGSNNYVSKIDPDDQTIIPPGSVSVVPGIMNPLALEYDSFNEAKHAANLVQGIEGFHTSIEELQRV